MAGVVTVLARTGCGSSQAPAAEASSGSPSASASAYVSPSGTCTTYTANGHEFTKIAALDLTTVKSAEATTAWCMVEADKDETVCHSVIAAQDLVSSLIVSSGDDEGAKDAVAVLTRPAAERITTQVS